MHRVCNGGSLTQRVCSGDTVPQRVCSEDTVTQRVCSGAQKAYSSKLSDTNVDMP